MFNTRQLKGDVDIYMLTGRKGEARIIIDRDPRRSRDEESSPVTIEIVGDYALYLAEYLSEVIMNGNLKALNLDLVLRNLNEPTDSSV